MHEDPRPRREPRPAVARLLTAPGEGGIAVIALAGEGAMEVLHRLFPSSGAGPADGTIAYGWIEEDGRRIDEALAWRSATGFEIGLHGGAASTAAVLRAFRRAGVRVESGPAAPAGSIEADAALLLPRAATLPAAMMLAAAASGELSRALASRDAARLRAMLARAPATILLATPCIVAIAGPPNAGKSTLLNALAKRDRALVHPQAGTTRDPVEAIADFGGYPVRLVDTAGLAGAHGGIDAEAERLAREVAEEARLVLWLEDPAAPSPPPGRAHIRLSGKSDLGPALPRALRVSGVSGEGLEELKRAVVANLGLPWPATAEPGPFLAEHVLQLMNALRDAAPPSLV